MFGSGQAAAGGARGRRRNAPETIVVDLADAALAALRRAILLEHATVAEFSTAQDSPILVRTSAVLHSATRLRRDLRAYRRAVDRVIAKPNSDAAPF